MATMDTSNSNLSAVSPAGIGNQSFAQSPAAVGNQSFAQPFGNASMAVANSPLQSVAVVASTETALRGEVKKLRDEMIELRREASKVKALQAEVTMLRNVTLMQSEEKVPIRLRELEIENLRLQRANRSLEEKLSSLEGEMKYRSLMSSANAIAMGDSRTAGRAVDSVKIGDMELPHYGNNSFGGREDRVGPGASASSPPGKVVVIKHGDHPCANCNMRISAAQKAFEGERILLVNANKELQAKLRAAEEEIKGVQAWVGPLVQSLQQFPRSAETQPLQQIHNFASPTRNTGEGQYYGAQRLGGISSSLQSPPNTIPPSTQWTSEFAPKGTVPSYLEYEGKKVRN